MSAPEGQRGVVGGGGVEAGRGGESPPLRAALFPSDPSVMILFAVMLRGQAPAAL